MQIIVYEIVFIEGISVIFWHALVVLIKTVSVTINLKLKKNFE